MRKPGFLVLLIILCSGIGAQIRESTRAINVEVAVRVFKGEEFVADLTKDDFEVSEDGSPQEILTCYLIRDNIAQNKQGLPEAPAAAAPNIKPNISRNFILVVQVMKYFSTLGDAIDLFFNEVLQRGDYVIVVSPLKTYHFHPEILDRFPKSEIAEQVKNMLRRDIRDFGGEYRNLIERLRSLLTSDTDEEIDLRSKIMQLLERIRDQFYLDQKKIIVFADALAGLEGQKHVFCILQNERMPIPDFIDGIDRMTLMQNAGLNLDAIKRAFSDRSIQFHFLYLTLSEDFGLDIRSQVPLSSRGVTLVEFKQEIFSAFKDIAEATGGMTESTVNLKHALKDAVDYSGRYYLLYYSPRKYAADGRYKKIEVRVKKRDVRVVHREGYVAD